MSTSLQYSDYSTDHNFVVPYNILKSGAVTIMDYLASCKQSMDEYAKMTANDIDKDDAGYIAPQALRGLLLISATPYQWKHMIAQRTCRRNSDEIRYVMLRIWEILQDMNPNYFSSMGPDCVTSSCKEGSMSCKRSLFSLGTPSDIIDYDYPLLR